MESSRLSKENKITSYHLMMLGWFFIIIILMGVFGWTVYRYQKIKSAHLLLTQAHQEVLLLNRGLETTLKLAQEQLSYSQQWIAKSSETMTKTMEQICAQTLLTNNQQFWQTATGVIDHLKKQTREDVSTQHKAFHDLVQPLNAMLIKVEEKVQDLEKQRLVAFTDLNRQLSDLSSTHKELRQETAKLIGALKNPTTRGKWGEMQLRRVVELAGMLEYCDFTCQGVLGDSKLRPDMIIRLPGDKNIILDAKVALSAYLQYLEATTDEAKEIFLRDHARQIRSHIKNLAQKAYWEEITPTPEFVVMFLPSEAIFSVALEKDPQLIEIGVQEKVIIATPITLIALLRAVAYGWRQENIAVNSQKISELAKELCKRLGDMANHFQKLGRSLSTAVDSYNQTLGSFEQRVLVSAKRFEAFDQGIQLKVELDVVDTPLRHLTKFDPSDLVE